MAKILKIKIKREVSKGMIHNTYPPEYDAKKIDVVAYEDLGDARKDFCIGVVSDADAPGFLLSPDIKEINKVRAKALGGIWRPQTEIINDPKKVLDVVRKVHNKNVLSARDRDAINPNKPDMGVSKSRHFNDILAAVMAKRNR